MFIPEKRGQISVEYLIVVGFIVFVIIGILGVAFFYASGVEDKIKANQLESFVNKIVSSAESVYFAGEPSKVTITAYLPKGVRNIVILEDPPNSGNYFVIFGIETSSGVSRLSFRVDVPLDSETNISTSEGVKRLTIEAGQNQVFITEG